MISLNLNGVLYLDIETAPQYKTYDELPERLKPLWDKRFSKMPEAIVNPDFNSRDNYYLCGLHGEFAKIVCISVGMIIGERKLKMTSFYGMDEKKLLTEFIAILNAASTKDKSVKAIQRLCAHNGKEFDFPVLCKRMIINCLEIPDQLQIAGKKPWDINHIDTKELWKFGSFKDSVSLDLLCAVLGIESPKDGITGADVAKAYWEENRLEDIKDYCQKDVVALVNVCMKMTGSEIITDENIVYSDAS